MQFFHMSCSSKNPNLPCRLTFCTRRVLVKVSTSSAKSLSSGFWCCCPAQPTKSWKNGASSRDLWADTSTRVHYILRSDHAHAEVLCKGNVALGNPYRTAWYSLSSRSLRICSTSDANINRPCAKEHTLIEKKVKGIYIYIRQIPVYGLSNPSRSVLMSRDVNRHPRAHKLEIQLKAQLSSKTDVLYSTLFF